VSVPLEEIRADSLCIPREVQIKNANFIFDLAEEDKAFKEKTKFIVKTKFLQKLKAEAEELRDVVQASFSSIPSLFDLGFERILELEGIVAKRVQMEYSK
jgi:hypothetical protein